MDRTIDRHDVIIIVLSCEYWSGLHGSSMHPFGVCVLSAFMLRGGKSTRIDDNSKGLKWKYVFEFLSCKNQKMKTRIGLIWLL